MPNWCEHDLTVEGKTEEVERFQKFAKSKDSILDQNKFIPYPKEFEDSAELKAYNEEEECLIKKYGSINAEEVKEWRFKHPRPNDGFNSGGYDWCINHWGTKWGIVRPEIDSTDTYKGVTTIEYTFECAWSPCLPIIKKMGEMFPMLTFDLRYFEQGMGFNGMYRVENGKVTDDKSGDYFGDRGG